MTVPALATLTLVWLGARGPDAAAALSLERWAHDHQVKLEAPRAAAPAELETSPSLAAQCEAWIAEARDLLQAGDDDAAQELLDRLDQNLHQHPELLQASFLLAERYRLQARLARRASAEQAERFEQLAEITEGPRASAFGDPSAARNPVASVRITLMIHGARRPEIYWDGASSNSEIVTPAGEHHLLVFRGARVAWAGWVSALSSAKVDVWVPDADACSTEDLAGVTMEGRSRVRVPSGVKCSSWIAVAPSDFSGALSLALCSADQCQAMGRIGEPVATGKPTADERGSKSLLPPWAAWTLAGVGVAAATSIVLWRIGVFDTARESKMIYDGSNL